MSRRLGRVLIYKYRGPLLKMIELDSEGRPQHHEPDLVRLADWLPSSGDLVRVPLMEGEEPKLIERVCERWWQDLLRGSMGTAISDNTLTELRRGVADAIEAYYHSAPASVKRWFQDELVPSLLCEHGQDTSPILTGETAKIFHSAREQHSYLHRL